MLHYINIGGQDRPVSFAYSVAYEYEVQTGRFYEPDVKELAMQVIAAGAALQTDDLATAARSISTVKFTDILFAAMLVGARKAGLPVDFDRYQVADWLGENPESGGRFTTLLLEANFNLKPDPAQDDTELPDEADDAKKKSPVPSIGTNS